MMDLSALPISWRERVNRETKNENLIWVGRPRASAPQCLYASFLFTLIIFSPVWLIGIVLLVAGLLTHPEGVRSFLSNVYLYYACAAIYVFFTAMVRVIGRRTVYAATDKTLFEFKFLEKVEIKRVNPTPQMRLKLKRAFAGSFEVRVEKGLM